MCKRPMPRCLSQNVGDFLGPSWSRQAGLGKVLIYPWLVTLLHICGVVPTPPSPISPETPRDRRRRRIERRRLRIEWPPRDRRHRCPKRRRLHIERRYCRIEWRVFHDVSQCFKYFMMFHNVLSISWCFTMFNNVLWCLASRATIGDRAATDRLRDWR